MSDDDNDDDDYEKLLYSNW